MANHFCGTMLVRERACTAIVLWVGPDLNAMCHIPAVAMEVTTAIMEASVFQNLTPTSLWHSYSVTVKRPLIVKGSIMLENTVN